jgi:ankyrin repeat protein
MYEYITATLKSSTKEQRFSWSEKPSNLAQMRTRDNRTPLVLAICHPKVTKEIIRNLLTYMKSNSEDSFNQTSSQPNIYQTQIFMAIGQLARQRVENYDYLTPVLDVDDCDPDTFNQFFHFPCRYNNVTFLQWLIEQSSRFNNTTIHRTQTSKSLNLNIRDYAGYTPLMTAVFYGSTECVTYLLQVNIFFEKIFICCCNHHELCFVALK